MTEPGPAVVLFDGEYHPEPDVRISPLDRGLLYGDGLFETIRAHHGRLLHLGAHMERLARSLAALRISPAWLPSGPDLEELLERNRLDVGPARVKVVVTRGQAPGLGFPEHGPPTVFALAAPYTPPPQRVYESGWRLMTFEEGRAPHLAAHKTLSYLFFLAARQGAVDQGFDEAVVLDRRGHVTETSAGSLLVRSRGRWWTPHSPDQLPGVTVAAVVSLLQESGSVVEPREAGPADLRAADTVWVSNSLMGIMPVRQIDHVRLPAPEAALAARLRRRLGLGSPPGSPARSRS